MRYVPRRLGTWTSHAPSAVCFGRHCPGPLEYSTLTPLARPWSQIHCYEFLFRLMAATNDGIAQLETTEASSSGQETTNSPKSDVGSSRPFFRKFTRSKSNSWNTSPTRKTSVSEHQTPVAVGQIERSNGNTGPFEQDVNETGQTKSKSTKATVSAIAKLKSLGGKKTKKEKLEFPPSSWGFNESNVPPTTTPANVTGTTSKQLPPAPTQDAALAASEDQQTDVKSSSSKDATPLPTGLEQPEETVSLARRIQVLLASIPLISSGTTTPNPSKLSISQNDTPTKGANDAPDVEMPTVPPAPTTSAMINDSRLMSLLSSASIMNGSLSKGKESVFAALDRLGIYSGPSRSASGSNIAQDKSNPSQTQAGSSSTTPQNQITPDDSSDLMLYGPLIPDRNSKVEIARSEIVSLDEDENGPTEITNGSVTPGQDKGKGKVSTPSAEGDEEAMNGVKKGKGKEKVVWVPSRTELSLQCTWWGYRM